MVHDGWVKAAPAKLAAYVVEAQAQKELVKPSYENVHQRKLIILDEIPAIGKGLPSLVVLRDFEQALLFKIDQFEVAENGVFLNFVLLFLL